MGDDEVTDVLVIGAGPTGLCAALTLRRRGVDAILVDRKHGPTRESRALAVQARTMEIYAQLGVVDRALDESVAADAIVPGYGSRAFAPIDLTELGRGLTPYPHLYVLEQSRNHPVRCISCRPEALAGEAVATKWQQPFEIGVIEATGLVISKCRRTRGFATDSAPSSRALSPSHGGNAGMRLR